MGGRSSFHCFIVNPIRQTTDKQLLAHHHHRGHDVATEVDDGDALRRLLFLILVS